MLDETTAGVSQIVMDELFEHINKVKKNEKVIESYLGRSNISGDPN